MDKPEFAGIDHGCTIEAGIICPINASEAVCDMRPSEALEKHRDDIRAVLSGYPVTNPRIFGSAARGEDTEESDLDILVERQESLTYYDIFRLEAELHHLIGVKVDVRTEGEFSPRILYRISRDFRPL